jgi:hypothetical protein
MQYFIENHHAGYHGIAREMPGQTGVVGADAALELMVSHNRAELFYLGPHDDTLKSALVHWIALIRGRLFQRLYWLL